MADRIDRQEVSLRALYDEHASALLSYALRLTNGDRGRAEDIVQETLLRAWRHLDALTPERGSTRAWLVTVARNVAVDAHRARSARPRCEISCLRSSGSSATPAPASLDQKTGS